MMKAAVMLFLGLLAGCTTVDQAVREETLPSRRPFGDGERLEVAINGRYFRPLEYGQDRVPRISDFGMFDDPPRDTPPDYVRVSRRGTEFRIELIGHDGAVVGVKVLTVRIVEEEGRVVVRHEERKSHGDEWGSVYYADRKDFYVTEDGGFFLHAHGSGASRILLVLPAPWKHQSYVLFPKKMPTQMPDPISGSVTSSADARSAPVPAVAHH